MPNCMRRLVLLVALGAGFASAAQPATAQQLVPFGGQTYTAPRYVAGEPGDPSRIYVVEGAGRIRLIINGATQLTPFLDIAGDVCFSNEGCGGESGLFSMAFAPDYVSSGLFYVFYTRDVAVVQHELVIREFRRTTDPNNIDEATGRDVLVIPHPDASNHNGGQLQFGPDGLLYISTGDGGSTPQNGQSTTTLLGKILRINPAGAGPGDYSIPASNPFVGLAGSDEIYSYGLRNPYRFSFDRLTGDLAIGDVGGGSREEIDFVPNGAGRGANFGWTCFEGNLQLSTTGPCTPPLPNYTPPVRDYTRAGSSAAVNGGYVVRDTALPSLLGRYLYADTFDALNNQIRSAQLFPGGFSGDAPTGMTASLVFSFGEDACGHVYVAHGSTVSRIEPSSGPFPCAPQQQITPPASGPPACSLPTGCGPPLGLAITVDGSTGRHATKRGEVRVIVGCERSCTVQGTGEIVMRGKNIGLDPDTRSLAAGIEGAITLDLSRKEARRLLAALADDRKAKAIVELTAADSLGNSAVAERSIKQKR
jgi:glucose/arabinose dehydrogenase